MAKDIHRSLKRIYYVGKFMDHQFSLPIIGSIGFDPIIGLVPIAGDIVGYIISCYIIVEAGRMGVPLRKISIMILNAIVDSIFGYIPFLGDVADFKFKANSRNVNIVLDCFQAEIDKNGDFKKLPVPLVELPLKFKVILWVLLILMILFLALIIAIPILIAVWLFSK